MSPLNIEQKEDDIPPTQSHIPPPGFKGTRPPPPVCQVREMRGGRDWNDRHPCSPANISAVKPRPQRSRVPCCQMSRLMNCRIARLVGSKVVRHLDNFGHNLEQFSNQFMQR